MKFGIVILVLAGVFFFVTRWGVISQTWDINSAYISLNRAILQQDKNAASRFNDWAGINKFPRSESDASAYGMAILLAHQANNLPEDWLQKWDDVVCRLTRDPTRNKEIEQRVTAVFAPNDLLAMVNCLDNQTIAEWLISAAENQPNNAMIYVREFEQRGLYPTLTPAEKIRLAAVYGDLADQLRRSGSSTNEVMVWVNKSLALDPQSEIALIVKAVMLGQSGQLPGGIALLEQVTFLYPKSYYAWECLAALRLNAQDYKGAETAARVSILSLPAGQGSWGMDLLAASLLKQGRCTEALPYAQVTAQDYPETPNYLLTLGDIYWCLGDRKQASETYQQLEKIDPSYSQYVQKRIQSTN